MADDQARRAHLPGRPLNRKPVKSEAADSALAVALGEQVRRRGLGDRAVEGRVEDRDVLRFRQQRPSLLDRRERRRVVQRRKLDQLLQFALDRVVDRGRIEELLTAVNDTVTDQPYRRRLLE